MPKKKYCLAHIRGKSYLVGISFLFFFGGTCFLSPSEYSISSWVLYFFSYLFVRHRERENSSAIETETILNHRNRSRYLWRRTRKPTPTKFRFSRVALCHLAELSSLASFRIFCRASAVMLTFT